MRLLKPYASIINVSHDLPAKSIDLYGRTCYKSEHPSDPEQWEEFIRRRISSGHESILEHLNVTVKIVCDRGVSHELVRHRLCGFSQESTRYCNYGKNDHVSFIIPCWFEFQECLLSDRECLYMDDSLKEIDMWLDSMLYAENSYKKLLSLNWTPQQARSVLPNSLKTELIMTTNIREWRHIFSLRCDKAAHPQMREIMIPLLKDFYLGMPVFFEDLYAKFTGGNCESEKSIRLDRGVHGVHEGK